MFQEAGCESNRFFVWNRVKNKQAELLPPVCPKSTINLTYTKYYGTTNLTTSERILCFFN